MQATKLKGIINQQGELIVKEPINLNPGEVEVVILQTDNLANQKQEIKPAENQEQTKVNKPIWQIAEDSIADMSEAEKAQLPHDGAVEHDHYIYGTPKINP